MSLRRLRLIAVLSAFIVTSMFVRPAEAAQGGPMYWVCSYDTRTKPSSTLYMSDVTGPFGPRMQNNYTSTVLSNEFTQFLNTTYKIAVAGSCAGYESIAKAQDAIKKRIEFAPSAKLVETHWKSTAPVETAAPAKPVTPPQSAGNPQPGTAASGAGALQGYCFAYTKQNFFITKLFPYGRDNAQVNEEFSDFLTKKYGAPAGTASRCASLRDLQTLANSRQNEINDSKRIPRAEMVEIDWAPAPKAAPPVPKPAPVLPPAAPPSRAGVPPTTPPATGAKPTVPATAPPAQPVAQAATMYSYCQAYGTPAGSSGTVKQHFYVSQPFQVTSPGGLNQQFEKFLGTAHAGEKISGSCLEPSSLDTAEKSRQTAIGLKRKQTATFDVVEVDWKR
jgi:hypothetical protein